MNIYEVEDGGGIRWGRGVLLIFPSNKQKKKMLQIYHFVWSYTVIYTVSKMESAEQLQYYPVFCLGICPIFQSRLLVSLITRLHSYFS